VEVGLAVAIAEVQRHNVGLAVGDPENLVQWFLLFDDKSADLRNNLPELLGSTAQMTLGVLQDALDVEELLQMYLSLVSDSRAIERVVKAVLKYGSLQAALRKGGEQLAEDLAIDTQFTAVARVLGYVLLEKHGFDLEALI
jgi:hypothetical protein